MKERKEYRQARIVNRKDKNFGKVIWVYKMPDSRFFANRWGAKYGPRAYFGDELEFDFDKPIPVMYCLENDERGPWTLGYVHPDDIKKVTPKNGTSERYGVPYIKVNGKNTQLDVFDMHDGIPARPRLVIALDKFKAPTWSPSWNWNVYCENRETAKKAE